MKNYKNYNLEDFLLDEQFKQWVFKGEESENIFWTNLENLYPEKKIIIDQAKALLLTWYDSQLILSDQDLEIQVERILTNTDKKTSKSSIHKLSKFWISIAASITLLCIGYFLYLQLIPKVKLDSNFEAYLSQVRTPLKEVLNQTNRELLINLPDGSKVYLTPQSRINYASDFIQNKKREVYLTGEAFFEVEKDAFNPFYVYANGLVTRVLGTSFLVKTSKDNVEVLVRSGKVSVLAMKDINNHSDRTSELLLTPNQQAIFSTKDQIISKSISSLPIELIKTEDKQAFVFKDQPVATVFEKLEKVYGIPISYDNVTMKNCSLYVELSNEPFFTKLDIICKTLGADYRISDGHVIISSEGCD